MEIKNLEWGDGELTNQHPAWEILRGNSLGNAAGNPVGNGLGNASGNSPNQF